MNEIFTICSGNGDEYKLQFTTENSGIISNDVFDVLFNHGIDVICFSAPHTWNSSSDNGRTRCCRTLLFPCDCTSGTYQYAKAIAEGYHKDFDK